jgi:hypothetical protein
MSIQAFFVAATVVALIQWLRLRERRLLPLLALFALSALGHFQDDFFAARPYHLAAGAAGLVLVVMLAPRPKPERGHPPAAPPDPVKASTSSSR